MAHSGISPSGSVQAPSGMVQFTSGSLVADGGSSTGVNDRPRRRIITKRKFSVSSPSKSVEYSTPSSSTSPSFFRIGPFSSTAIQTNVNAVEIDAKSSGRGKKCNDSGEVEQNKEVEKECNDNGEAEQNKEAREAYKERSVSTSVTMISRILKGIPQSPHFYQLRNQSKLVRKSIIASWDSIFEETVEQIQSLRANDFWVRTEELWKTLEELQTVGYNVVVLRRRLVELSDVMTEAKLSELEIKRLNVKAENHRAEKSRLEFVILNLQEMISEEQEGMDTALDQMRGMVKELPKFDGEFAKLAMEPLRV